ncbi:unnamed protein product [Parascedosporium putredinis]|uniref:SET domain-containing protein n=1 Tax=Parascedosporium putredinis TaxID=1442378 RepID=A0A9P1M9F2_9PEZI|nr:unnamed protein product [Parascedosporium putredinis]CAI7991913.1 unnamed protein product [Parascedosporium putredinis]
MHDAAEGIRTKQLTSMSRKSVGRLPDTQKKRVSEMASMPGLDFLWGRFDTNAFGVDLAGNYDHRGLFPEIARINHDCRPSCYTRYSSRLLTMEAIAYRDIKQGEELSIAYTPLNLQTEDRQDIIQRWGFNCTCQLCSDPALSASSDRNRQRIAGIITEANGPQSREREVLARLSEEMKELVEAEELESLAGTYVSGVDHPRVEKARSVIGKLKASIKGRKE